MNRFIAFVGGALIMVALGVMAQSSGYPTRPRFQALTVADINMTPISGTSAPTLTTGCTTTPAFALRYSSVGNITSISSTGLITCTANAVTRTTAAGAVPTSITPVSGSRCMIVGTGENAAVTVPLALSITSTGVLSFGMVAGASGCSSLSGFANSGAFQIHPFSMTYARN